MDYTFVCLQCNTEVTKTYVKPSWIAKGKAPKFCSKRCAQLAARRRVTVRCDWCMTPFESTLSHVARSPFNFCSRVCKDHAQAISGGEKFDEMRPPHYQDGISKYQDRAYEYYGTKCTRCGYDENKHALQVHHIDGDRSNNDLDNLEVLCANCHAIEHRG